MKNTFIDDGLPFDAALGKNSISRVARNHDSREVEKLRATIAELTAKLEECKLRERFLYSRVNAHEKVHKVTVDINGVNYVANILSIGYEKEKLIIQIVNPIPISIADSDRDRLLDALKASVGWIPKNAFPNVVDQTKQLIAEIESRQSKQEEV